MYQFFIRIALISMLFAIFSEAFNVHVENSMGDGKNIFLNYLN
jgi:hypothetical protein